ncbi:MAG: hypothetical protein CVT47_00170 [Thermoplasmata archaeon HGW-Thermoplasmata-2]|nr:MAG: hypothetical protein CVT47_00170 [Thermoplasmata archaeon HGW-Thermoplasmata-2]
MSDNGGGASDGNGSSGNNSGGNNNGNNPNNGSTSPPAPAPLPAQPLQNKWAVLVGMSDYPPEGAGGSDLSDCHIDVELCHQYLISCDFPEERIRIFLNSSATIQKVAGALERLVKNADENSTVFFYYSGHGSGIGVESYINLWDGDLSGNSIKNAVSGLRSKKAFFGFDACLNGGMDGVGTGPLHLTDGLAAPCRIIVSASSEITLSYSTGSGGAFTRAFIKEGLMEGKGDSFILGSGDGKTSIEEAFNYAFYRCETAGTSLQAPAMLPQINDQYDGEMTL